MRQARDYGRDGTVAIGVPQANPTVEAEMAILMPPTVARVTTRLVSDAASSRDRLCEYLIELERALATFDRLRPQVFGFACTASSYLLGPEREAEIVRSAESGFGYPVITAASAIQERLRAMGARRIALLSPYPAALGRAAEAFWSARGFELVGRGSVPLADGDTRAIYRLASEDARPALAALADAGADALLVTGTGMASLPLIADAPAGAPPILSSNLALAEACLARLGGALGDWRARLRAATGSAE